MGKPIWTIFRFNWVFNFDDFPKPSQPQKYKTTELELDNFYEVIDDGSMEVAGKKDVRNKQKKRGILFKDFPEIISCVASLLDPGLCNVDPGRSLPKIGIEHEHTNVNWKKRKYSDQSVVYAELEHGSESLPLALKVAERKHESQEVAVQNGGGATKTATYSNLQTQVKNGETKLTLNPYQRYLSLVCRCHYTI